MPAFAGMTISLKWGEELCACMAENAFVFRTKLAKIVCGMLEMAGLFFIERADDPPCDCAEN